MRWATIDKLVLWNQTLFGLPWVATTAVLAIGDAHQHAQTTAFGLWTSLWMVVAFIAARMAGMAFNRLIDRDIDARNPRTRDRVLPRGEATTTQVAVVGLVSLAIFIIACGLLNPLCLALCPLPIALLFLYSYTKRFTPLCHFVLGLLQFLGPVFAWIAIRGEISLEPLLLGGALMLSMAGSDIVYALLDVDFDRSVGLHSMPLLLGTKRALVLARLLHGCTVLLLLAFAFFAQLNVIFLAGVGVVGMIYWQCYAELRPEVPERLHLFLSNCNRRVAVALMIFSTGSVLWQHWS